MSKQKEMAGWCEDEDMVEGCRWYRELTDMAGDCDRDLAAKNAEIAKLTAWVKAAKGSLDERTLTGINARSHLEYAIAKKALEAGQ